MLLLRYALYCLPTKTDFLGWSDGSNEIIKMVLPTICIFSKHFHKINQVLNEMFTKIIFTEAQFSMLQVYFLLAFSSEYSSHLVKVWCSTEHYPINVTSVSDQRNRQIMTHMLNRIIQTSDLTTHNRGTSYIYRTVVCVLSAWLGNAK